MRWLPTVSCLVTSILIAVPADGQVTAETVFEDGDAAAMIRNAGPDLVLVTVDLQHGFVRGDRLELTGPVDALITPREFSLRPGASQTVRMRLREAVAAGTVLRLVTTLTPVTPESADEDGIVTRLVLATRFVTRAVVR